MKVIIGTTSFDLDNHAKDLLRSQTRMNKKMGGGPPIGIATTLAKFIHACDDCGLNYWDASEYGYNHLGCKGVPSASKLGFAPIPDLVEEKSDKKVGFGFAS